MKIRIINTWIENNKYLITCIMKIIYLLNDEIGFGKKPKYIDKNYIERNKIPINS